VDLAAAIFNTEVLRNVVVSYRRNTTRRHNPEDLDLRQKCLTHLDRAIPVSPNIPFVINQMDIDTGKLLKGRYESVQV